MPRTDPAQWSERVRRLPVCPKRRLPIPYIAEIGPDGVGHFTILDAERARECLEHRLCAMCGDPMDWWIALVGDVVSLDRDGFFIEPPVHPECAEDAIGGLCPFLSTEGVPRRPPEDGVALVGTTREDLTAVGRTVAKRSWLVAIVHDYGTKWIPSRQGSPVMVYRAGRVARTRTFDYDERGALAETTPPPNGW